MKVKMLLCYQLRLLLVQLIFDKCSSCYPFICIKEMSNKVLGKLIHGDILYKSFYCCSFRLNEVTVRDLCFRSGPSSTTRLCNKIKQRNDRGKVKIATLLLGLS
jgi:hypothetical protein